VGRQGRLCGNCKQDMSPALFSGECIHDANCNSYTWIIPLILIIPFLLVFAFAKMYRPIEDAYAGFVKVQIILGPLVLFYQISPLFVSHFSARALRRLGLIIAAISSAKVSSSSSDFIICFAPNQSTVQRIMLSYTVPGAFLSSVGVLALTCAIQRKLGKTPVLSWGAITSVLLFVSEFTYSTILQTSFSLLQCPSIEGENRLWLSAEHVCLQPWQIGLSFITLLLILVPIVFTWVALRLKRGKNEIQRAAWEALCSPYRDDARWSVGQPLVRRLIFISIYTFTTNPTPRTYALFLISLLFLLQDVWGRPFRHTIVSRYNLCCQISLVVMAGSSIVLATTDIVAGLDATGQAAVVFAIVGWFFPAFAFAAVALIVFFRLQDKFRKMVGKRPSKKSKIHQNRTTSVLSKIHLHHEHEQCSIHQRLTVLSWQLLAAKILHKDEEEENGEHHHEHGITAGVRSNGHASGSNGHGHGATNGGLVHRGMSGAGVNGETAWPGLTFGAVDYERSHRDSPVLTQVEDNMTLTPPSSVEADNVRERREAWFDRDAVDAADNVEASQPLVVPGGGHSGWFVSVQPAPATVIKQPPPPFAVVAAPAPPAIVQHDEVMLSPQPT